MNTFSKAVSVRVKILGWYQIIGGIGGVIFTFYLLAKIVAISGLFMIIYLIAFGLFIFSVYCGRLLLIGKYNLGLMLTIINQLFQTVSFLLAGYGFMYIAGCMLLASISYSSFEHGSGLKMGLNFNLTPVWRIFLNSDDHSFDLSLNLLALYLTYFTYKLQERMRNEALAMQNPVDNNHIDDPNINSGSE